MTAKATPCAIAKSDVHGEKGQCFMKRKDSGRAAELLFCGGNRVCNLVGLITLDLIREKLRFSGYRDR